MQRAPAQHTIDVELTLRALQPRGPAVIRIVGAGEEGRWVNLDLLRPGFAPGPFEPPRA